MSDLIKLTSTANRMDADMLIQMLKNYDIESVKKDLSGGNLIQASAGNMALFGVEIYVMPDNLEKAKDILEEWGWDWKKGALVTSDVGDNGTSNEKWEIEIEYRRKKMVIRLVILFVLLVGLFSMIWSVVQNFIIYF